MSERKIRTYTNEAIQVTYDLGRCIHAEECVRGLPAVFDPAKRPWIQPGNAPAEDVALVIMRCPTGALHYQRQDGGAAEPIPKENTLHIKEDGPLYLTGDVQIVTADEKLLLEDTRVALCRCGTSADKPFCDNSHRGAGFSDPGRAKVVQRDRVGYAPGGVLVIQPSTNGPYLLEGNFTILDRDGNVVFLGDKAELCRCGGSQNKPFCDGTHKQKEFLAD